VNLNINERIALL